MLYNHDDISHTHNTKHTQIQNTLVKTGGLCCFRYEWFINFWLLFVHMRKETQFLKTYANHTIWPQRRAHLVMSKISVGWDSKKTNYIFQWQKLDSMPPWSNLNWLFFKILKFSGPSLPGMTSSTLQPHFLSGGLLCQWYYLPTPPLGQDMTQGQFLSGV